MGGFDAVRDIGAQQDAEDGKDGHDGEDDLVAVDTLMAIEDGAVDGVHEGAGQIADEGGHGHGRACDFAGDVDFIHGGEEDGAHAVDADEPEIHEMPWRPLNADSYLTDLKYKKI